MISVVFSENMAYPTKFQIISHYVFQVSKQQSYQKFRQKKL